MGIQRGMNHLYNYVANNPIINSDIQGLLTCGSGWNDPFVPDNPFGFQFSPCCEIHDNCYGNCGSKKTRCDNNFEACMLGTCDKLGEGVRKQMCINLALTYAGAVKKYGNPAFKNAQSCCKGTNP